MKLSFFIASLAALLVQVRALQTGNNITALVDDAVQQHKLGNHAYAQSIYLQILEDHPENADAWHLLGLSKFALNESELAAAYIQKSLLYDSSKAFVFTNLAEILRKVNRVEDSIQYYESALSLQPNSIPVMIRMAEALTETQQRDSAVSLLYKALSLDGHHKGVRRALADILLPSDPKASLQLFQRLSSESEYDEDILMGLGSCFHKLGQYEEAKEAFKKVIDINPGHCFARGYYGAIFHEQGQYFKARDVYKDTLAKCPGNMMTMNNLGTLLSVIGERKEGLILLRQVLEADPYHVNALVNVVNEMSMDGNFSDAEQLLDRAYSVRADDSLQLRKKLWLPQIPMSEADIEQHRGRFLDAAKILLTKQMNFQHALRNIHVVPQFYSVYHNKNEVEIQTLMGKLFRQSIPDLDFVSPFLKDGKIYSPPHQGKIRVGFLSTFFVYNHPHMYLLKGIMARLRRDIFQIEVYAVPYGLPVADEVREVVDEVVLLPEQIHAARAMIVSRQADIIVFADIVSNCMTYLLAFSRLAPVQALFWGNPVTSGSPVMDYFISGEHMEDHKQCRDHYTENLVLLRGQAIWYDPLELPTELIPRENAGLKPEWTVYVCAQSLFKLHPSFDFVLRDILKGDPNGHILMLEGRRPTWTLKFKERLRFVLGEDMARVHFLPRVGTSIAYLQILKLGDVALHPFPFDGSKTSADAIALGLPLVTYPGSFLRGRMAFSFFQAMGVLDTVAYSREEYISIALKLGSNSTFREEVSRKYRAHSHVIFENLEVVQQWEAFLAEAAKRSGHGGANGINLGRLPIFLARSDTSALDIHGRKAKRVVKLKSARFLKAETAEAHNSMTTTSVADASQIAHSKVLLSNAGQINDHKDMSISPKKQPSIKKLLETVTEASLVPGRNSVSQNNTHETSHGSGGVKTRELLVEGLDISKEQADCSHLERMAAVQLGSAEHSDVAPHLTGSTTMNLSDHCLRIYGTILGSRGLWDELLNNFARLLELPHATEQLEVLIFLSVLDISTTRWHHVHTLERRLRKRYGWPKGSFFLLRKSRWLHQNYLQSMILLVQALNHKQQVENNLDTVHAMLQQIAEDEKSQPPREVHLIVQYYHVEDSKRQKELDFCLEANILNPHIRYIHILTELETYMDRFEKTSLSAWGYNKLIQTPIGTALTYAAGFLYASTNLRAGAIVILSHADIRFDETLRVLVEKQDLTMDSKFYALTPQEDRKLTLVDIKSAQQSLIFKSPLPEEFRTVGLTSELETMIITKKILETMETHGIHVVNPAFILKSFKSSSPTLSVSESLLAPDNSVVSLPIASEL